MKLFPSHPQVLLSYVSLIMAFSVEVPPQEVRKVSIQHYRKYNPDKPVEIFYLPSIVRLMIRGMSCYDPHFGAAFHENTWNAGFDHAETLTRIQCPALLLHAKTEIMEDGTLNGAMSQEEADCIVTLIPNCKYLKV